MPRTASLASIESQIEKLQQRANAIREKEKVGVVARIKEAIAHYGLTSDELFSSSATKPAAKRRAGPSRPAKAEAPVKTGRRASPQAGTKVAPKYRDDAGNAWTGRGSQPRWVTAALAEGKTLEDFAIKS